MLSTVRKSPPRCECLCVPPFDRGEGHCNDNDEVGTGRRIVDDEDDDKDDDEDDDDEDKDEDKDAMSIIAASASPNRTSRDTLG